MMRTNQRYAAASIALVHAFLALGPTCLAGPVTVEGPESNSLQKQIQGTIAILERGGILHFYTLPALRHTALVLPRPARSVVTFCGLAGPSAAGTFAWHHDNSPLSADGSKSHQLHMGQPFTGTSSLQFERPGDSNWDHKLSSTLAMSPTGDLACIKNMTPIRLQKPQTYLLEGCLEIWNTTTKGSREPGLVISEHGLCWFPDGKRLACVIFVPRAQCPAVLLQDRKYAECMKYWHRLPVVHILDVATSKATPFHLGWEPVVSTDGKSMLVCNIDYDYRLIELSSGKAREADWPGQYGAPIAFIDSKLVIYRGWPTKGSAIRYTQFNSPLVGKKQMLTVKAAYVNTRTFQTLVPYIDPRWLISYGPVVADRMP